MKASERLPRNEKFHPVRTTNGRYYEGYMSAGMFQVTGVFSSPKDYHLYEWLDESAPQVFTREDMAKTYIEGFAKGSDGIRPDFQHYMDTNYPTK